MRVILYMCQFCQLGTARFLGLKLYLRLFVNFVSCGEKSFYFCVFFGLVLFVSLFFCFVLFYFFVPHTAEPTVCLSLGYCSR